jgi:hypothetical protein
MQSATTIKGIVHRAAGVPRQSSYNMDMVVSIAVKNPDNSITNIWGVEGSTISLYKMGDPIEYAKSGKEYVFFHAPTAQSVNASSVGDATKTPTPSVQAPLNIQNGWVEPSAVTKKSMLEYTAFQAKVYLHIFKSVSDDFADMGLKDAELKDISTTIFIQTQRKFNF